MKSGRNNRRLGFVVGSLFLPAVWIVLKFGLGIEDRYLPSPIAVLQSLAVLDPNILLHSLATAGRVVIGISAGTAFGLILGLALWYSPLADALLQPSIQAMRAVPAIAFIPFILIWFGFSEIGKVLIVLGAVGFNLSVATAQGLSSIPTKYLIAFRSFGSRPQAHLFAFALPFVMRSLLPTVRYSLGLAIATIVVTELLGAQTGLGYLIQTSRSTFSLHVILLACIALGLITISIDTLLVRLWNRYWA